MAKLTGQSRDDFQLGAWILVQAVTPLPFEDHLST